MKNKKQIAIACVATSVLFSSCGTMNNSVKGAGIGTAAGALLGAGVGALAGNTGLGTVIGAVVGGTAGTLIGKKMDKQKQELEKSLENAKVESINNGEAIRVTFDSGILFATGSSSLNADSRDALSKLATSLTQNPQTNIRIIGHTDNTGSDRVNDPLSVNRAMSVYSFLLEEGIDYSRMDALGKGSKEPIADNSTPGGRQANRRVEVYILPSQEMISSAQNGTLK